MTIFESGVIGFFVGAIVSTYILCIDGIGGYVGQILSAVSLRPVLGLFSLSGYAALAVGFVFYVLVYVLYAAVIGFLVKKNLKTLFFIVPIVVILAASAFVQQIYGQPEASLSEGPYSFVEVTRVQPSKEAPQQYFGNEAVGDLNGDGKDDVAFILFRSDPDRGMLYYLSTALSADNGHQGTNLVFLGNDVVPKTISITGGIIAISYVDASDTASTSTSYFYAHIIDGTLEQIQLAQNRSLLWGDISMDGDALAFKPCGEDDVLALGGPSTTTQMIQDELDQAASTSGAASPVIMAALTGQKQAVSVKNASSSLKSDEFLVDTVVTFVPNSSCQ